MSTFDQFKAVANLKKFIESLVGHEAFLITSSMSVSFPAWVVQVPKEFIPQVKAYVEINKDQIGEVSLVPSDRIYAVVDPWINYISDIAPEGRIFRRGI